MNNENLEAALGDLCEAIRNVTLGSIEYVVMDAAARELIANWNDHNADDPIDEVAELANWAEAEGRPKQTRGLKSQLAPCSVQPGMATGQLYAPNGKLITAAKDWIPGNALIMGASRNADGSLEIEWEGETKICWDGQHTETDAGLRIFLDEDGNEWREDQLFLAT